MDFIMYIWDIICYILLALFVIFMIADWLFEKYDIRKNKEEDQRRKFYERWRTIRKHF